jgi:hypothetical protein
MYAVKKVKIDLGDYSGGKKKSAQLERAISAVGGVNTNRGIMKPAKLPKRAKYEIDIELE